MDGDETTGGISWRSIIKRVGAGAAVVWATPVVTTVGARALAAPASPAPGGTVCPNCDLTCPLSGNQCAPGCFCFTRQSGGCECVRANLCGGAIDCTSDADCTGHRSVCLSPAAETAVRRPVSSAESRAPRGLARQTTRKSDCGSTARCTRSSNAARYPPRSGARTCPSHSLRRQRRRGPRGERSGTSGSSGWPRGSRGPDEDDAQNRSTETGQPLAGRPRRPLTRLIRPWRPR